MRIATVTESDLDDLRPLMRGYCDFYGAEPSDAALLELSQALVRDPDREGFQVVARRDDGRAVGFATVFWSWSTLSAARIGVMNDLFVDPDARGGGVADALIQECLRRARERGCALLEWQTASDNGRAQKVYERVGGKREDQWVTYSLKP